MPYRITRAHVVVAAAWGVDKNQLIKVGAEMGENSVAIDNEIENAISSKTKAIIVNSPNNPTGRVYDEGSMRELGELLRKKGSEMGRDIYS